MMIVMNMVIMKSNDDSDEYGDHRMMMVTNMVIMKSNDEGDEYGDHEVE